MKEYIVYKCKIFEAVKLTLDGHYTYGCTASKVICLNEENKKTTRVADVSIHHGWEQTSQLLIESHGPNFFLRYLTYIATFLYRYFEWDPPVRGLFSPKCVLSCGISTMSAICIDCRLDAKCSNSTISEVPTPDPIGVYVLAPVPWGSHIGGTYRCPH